mgnify:FL=1
MVNESIVLDYYVELIAADQIEFLTGRKKSKAAIISCINEMKKADSIHNKIEVSKNLWKLLFENAMSFIDKDKHGYDDLFAYFDEFVEFEELIFASDSFYRDHTIHSLWVYFLGEYLYRNGKFGFFFKNMMAASKEAGQFIKQFIDVDFFSKEGYMAGIVDSFEQLDQCQGAIRCVVALAHDLGYPLKKIQKVNKSILKILPHFAISNFDEFKFTYNTSQLPFIEKFLEFISLDFVIYFFERHSKKCAQIIEQTFSYNAEPDGAGLMINKEELERLSEDERDMLEAAISPRINILKKMSNYLRYSDDFEQQQHGILSSFLLTKKLWFFKNIPFAYEKAEELNRQHVDFHKVFAGTTILSAIADHTSDGFRIKAMNNPSALLAVVDELEEFSRISRANQNRQYINQFCRTDLYNNDNWLCIDFIFDNPEITNLNPEKAFRGRCKRFLSLFDIPELDESIKIRLRCLSQLPDNRSEYVLEISKNYANIAVNGVEQDIPQYLHSRQFYAKDELGENSARRQ